MGVEAMSDQLALGAAEEKASGSALEITADLRRRLRERYGETRRYAVLEEVADATGYAASRSCDLVAFNLWPSDGLEWQGHEIKASRSDWLREIKDPDKADAFAVYCDRWWIVAGDRSMVKKEELREGWGLLVPGGDGLRVVIGAAKREPKEPPRRLVSAILRRSQEASPGEQERRTMKQQMDNAIAKAKMGQQQAERAAERAKSDLDDLRRGVAAFQAASGLEITGYSGGMLGEQVALLTRMQVSSYRLSEYRRLAQAAEGLAREAKEAEAAAMAFASGMAAEVSP